MAKSVQDLAQALPESERRELFDRIQRSLSLNSKQDQAIVKAPSSADYRNHMIQEGLGQLGLVQRLVLWLRKVFTNRSDGELFVEMKMEELGKTLESHRLGDPAANMIEPGFAQAVYQLYLCVIPIRRFLKIIWANEDALRQALQFVLEERIPRARSRLFDFIPLQEIQILFEAAENKGTIRQELLNRLNVYMDGIPGEIFTELEQGIMPLYHLRQLCFFDYQALFKLFFVDQQGLEKGSVQFKSAAVSKVLEPIEALYYAMHTARKAASLEILPPQLYKFVQTRRYEQEQTDFKSGRTNNEVFNTSALPEPEELSPVPATADPEAPKAEKAPEQDKDSPQVLEEGLRQLRKDLRQLQEVLGQAMEKTRIADVIKFFQGDPYYRFLAYVPSINLKDFYISTLRMQLLGSLDKEYAAIRAMIVINIVKTLFPKGITEFTHFRRHPFGPPRGGLAGFKYVLSLQYLSNFLNLVFFGGLRDICRAMVKGLPNRNRDTGSEILFHTSGLESVHEKVKVIDYSFSPDSEDGKSFMRMKNSVEKDVAQEKQYRAFIAQRDKDNRDLLEEAIEHVRALGESISEVASIPTPLLSERFALIASQNGQPGNFGDFMRGVSIKFRTADRLLRYQRALDDETMA